MPVEFTNSTRHEIWSQQQFFEHSCGACGHTWKASGPELVSLDELDAHFEGRWFDPDNPEDYYLTVDLQCPNCEASWMLDIHQHPFT